jgi:hypothetical protein
MNFRFVISHADRSSGLIFFVSENDSPFCLLVREPLGEAVKLTVGRMSFIFEEQMHKRYPIGNIHFPAVMGHFFLPPSAIFRTLLSTFYQSL